MASTDVSASFSVASRVALLALFGTASALCFYHSHRLRRRRRIIISAAAASPRRAKLFFASQTGTSKSLALRLSTLLSSNRLDVDLLDPAEYEPEDLPNETLVLLVASTWEDGNPPPNAAFLARWLSESADDFRVGSLLLSRCRFAVFGVGSGSYGPTYNAAAKNFSRWFKALGASQLLPPCEADCDGEEGLERAFDRWSRELLQVLLRGCCRGGDAPRTNDPVNGLPNGKEEKDDDSGEDDYDDDSDADVGAGSEPDIVDLEDIAGKAPTARKTSTKIGSSTPARVVNGEENLEKEMVTPVIRASLEKQVCLPIAPFPSLFYHHCFIFFVFPILGFRV